MTQQYKTRINPNVRSIFMNQKRYGDMGGTTEMMRLIYAQLYAGYRPAIVSADPTSSRLTSIFGQRDATGRILPAGQQEMGKGVNAITLKEYGSLADALSSYDGDMVIDFKGGEQEDVFSMFGSLGQLLDGIDDAEFFFPMSVKDLGKSFENIEEERQALASVSSKVHLIRIFSLGICGDTYARAEVLKKYNDYMADPSHVYPTNVDITTVVFDTKFGNKPLQDWFDNNDARANSYTEKGAVRMVGAQFLNEGDKFWINYLFNNQGLPGYYNPTEFDRLRQLPNWQTPTNPDDCWGKIIDPANHPAWLASRRAAQQAAIEPVKDVKSKK
ncbi:hypothetical protein [Burkholderia cenocepacia]|uniref:Uncharacterized protein n=1 Tax=Burkholderia cenocepacia TaxID=95486 RepID=A0ABD4UCN7_9BURK|nr:hypothetical protein [Burkholderia cenocepacia]MCW3696320.1 hypothetical protein [Burkholderia cenocepacia]MCW3704461.1 hypothetical protein [Burkholderia cenocepacia]MCW3712100.1 hypothetical protein [Burkholderia cenocepacia]MCW3720099.1 hypothetical protein [Burkholderia cenocepacia]MCW3727837.1 hypothetical protein [Burkholderia cenocepacia]